MAVSIKEISLKNDIKFENLLGGLATEEVLKRISKSPFSKRLWICTPSDFGIEVYKKNANRSLRMAYEFDKAILTDGLPGSKLNDKLKGAILLALTGGQNNNSDKITGKHGNDGSICLDVYMEKMRVPIRLELFSVPAGKLVPEPKDVYLNRDDETLTVLRFPVASAISRDLRKIFSDFELIGDMSCFERLYNEIISTPVDGKAVWSELYDHTKLKKIHINEESLAIFEGYKKDKHMAKKWDMHIKRHKNMYPDWKKTVTAILVFVKPICEAIYKDQPFVGDWIPELGRFL